jgi:hypothetical protein
MLQARFDCACSWTLLSSANRAKPLGNKKEIRNRKRLRLIIIQYIFNQHNQCHQKVFEFEPSILNYLT